MTVFIVFAILLGLMTINLILVWNTTKALRVSQQDLLENPTPIVLGALIAGVILLLMKAY